MVVSGATGASILITTFYILLTKLVEHQLVFINPNVINVSYHAPNPNSKSSATSERINNQTLGTILKAMPRVVKPQSHLGVEKAIPVQVQ